LLTNEDHRQKAVRLRKKYILKDEDSVMRAWFSDLSNSFRRINPRVISSEAVKTFVKTGSTSRLIE